MKHIVLIIVIVVLYACDSAISEVVKLEKGDFSLVLENGVLKHNDTPFNGIITGYDTVNGTYSETTYAGGRKSGLEKKVYENGNIAEERYYSEGRKVDIHKGWYDDGTLKFEYHFNEDGVYDGQFRQWYANGQLLKSFNYENGVENGSQKMWLANGNIRANYVVKNGERYGLIGLKKCYTVTKK